MSDEDQRHTRMGGPRLRPSEGTGANEETLALVRQLHQRKLRPTPDTPADVRATADRGTGWRSDDEGSETRIVIDEEELQRRLARPEVAAPRSRGPRSRQRSSAAQPPDVRGLPQEPHALPPIVRGQPLTRKPRVEPPPPQPPERGIPPPEQLAPAPILPRVRLQPPTQQELAEALRGVGDRFGPPRHRPADILAGRVRRAPRDWTSPMGRFLAVHDPIVGPALVRLDELVRHREGWGNLVGILHGIWRSLEDAATGIAGLPEAITALVDALPDLIIFAATHPWEVPRLQQELMIMGPLRDIGDDFAASVEAAENDDQIESSSRAIQATVKVLGIISGIEGAVASAERVPATVGRLRRAAQRLRAALSRRRAVRAFLRRQSRIHPSPQTVAALEEIFKRAESADLRNRFGALGELDEIQYRARDPRVRRIHVVPQEHKSQTPDLLVEYNTNRPDALPNSPNPRIERVEIRTMAGESATGQSVWNNIKIKAVEGQLTARLPGRHAPPEGAVVIRIHPPPNDLDSIAGHAIGRVRSHLGNLAHRVDQWLHLRRIEIVSSSGERLIFRRVAPPSFFEFVRE